MGGNRSCKAFRKQGQTHRCYTTRHWRAVPKHPTISVDHSLIHLIYLSSTTIILYPPKLQVISHGREMHESKNKSTASKRMQ